MGQSFLPHASAILIPMSSNSKPETDSSKLQIKNTTDTFTGIRNKIKMFYLFFCFQELNYIGLPYVKKVYFNEDKSGAARHGVTRT